MRGIKILAPYVSIIPNELSYNQDYRTYVLFNFRKPFLSHLLLFYIGSLEGDNYFAQKQYTLMQIARQDNSVKVVLSRYHLSIFTGKTPFVHTIPKEPGVYIMQERQGGLSVADERVANFNALNTFCHCLSGCNSFILTRLQYILRTEYLKTDIGWLTRIDAETASHEIRVAGIALRLCSAIGFGGSEAALTTMSALLHDVGKAYVPNVILKKPYRLSDSEYRCIQAHPLYGADILRKGTFPDAIVSVAAEHHERWDGAGYPLGLKADEISVAARIVGLADAVDAMLARRCYREPMSPADVYHEVERCTGTQFDPLFSNLLLQNWQGIINY